MGLTSFLHILRHSRREDNLRQAASQGDEQRLLQLLKAGTAVDPAKKHHTGALQLAARNGCLACAKELIEAGADVNRASSDGSPLLDAASFGHVEVVRLLLEKKADPTVAVGGNTALHMAARFGHKAVIDALVQVLVLPNALSAVNDEGKTALAAACMLQKGGEEVVAFLLQAGADPAAADKVLNTPLHNAAVAGNLATVKLLLAAGASSSKANSKGRTPLHLAALCGHKQVVELLAQEQDNLTVADIEGSTALHMVCKSLLSDPGSQRSMACIMVDAGVDPQCRDKAGHTAADYTDSEDLKQLLATVKLSVEGAAPPTKPVTVKSEAAGGGPHRIPQATAANLCDSMSGGTSALNSESGAAGPVASAAASPAATSKAEKMASVVASMAAIIGSGSGQAGNSAAGTHSWVAKEAMRRHTSEQQEWTLKTADDSTVMSNAQEAAEC